MTTVMKTMKLLGASLILLGSTALQSNEFYNDYNDYSDFNGDCCYNDCQYQCCEESRFEVWADYLYWRAHEDNLNFAIEDNTGPTKVNVHQAPSTRTKKPNFKYDSGYRIGAGMTTSWCFECASGMDPFL